MKNLYVINAELEKCSYNKERIDLIMPHTALHYIIDGYGYFNGTRLGKGQFFCAVKNEKVCYFQDEEKPWSYIYIDFEGDDLEEMAEHYGFKGKNTFGKADFLQEIAEIKNLFQIYREKNIENKAFFNSLALAVLSLHDADFTKSENLTVTALHVKKIKEYIHRHFNKKITVEEIAKKLFLSRAYVRNIFYDSEGVSPKKYLQRVRMEKAAELLNTTSYKISEISVSVGYEDQLAFSKAFKGYYGSSPNNYRNERMK